MGVTMLRFREMSHGNIIARSLVSRPSSCPGRISAPRCQAVFRKKGEERPKPIAFLLIVWMGLNSGLARGGEIAGSVTWSGANDYSNVVVYAEKVPRVSVRPPKEPLVVDQVRLTFVPHVLPVVVGTTVSFPNNDEVGHNVYSPSPAKRFNLGVYPHGVVRQITFDKPGEVALLCNVHEQMSAYVLVLETPYYVVTAKGGNYLLKELPPGRYTVTAWHKNFQSVAHPVEIKGVEMIRLDFSFATQR